MRAPSAAVRLAAVGASALLLLAGCAAADAPEQDAAVALPAAEGVTEYPLTLESPFGDTVLEQRPERIAVVTASTIDSDALLAVGAVPVLAPSTLERNTWLEAEQLDAIGTLWESEAGAVLGAETVAAADPDLIVALYSYDDVDQAYFDQLSAIAPVLYGAADELSWQEITVAVGEPLDLAGAAERAVADAEASVERARAEHPEFEGASAAHVIVYEQEYGAVFASEPGSDTAALFADLGFVEPAGASRFPVDGLISDELVGLIDADFVLLSTFGAASDYFLEQPLVQQVPAVAEGRAIVNEADPVTEGNDLAWGLNVQSALSLPWLIDRLSGLAVEALG